jgi:hypothetical protein
MGGVRLVIVPIGLLYTQAGACWIFPDESAASRRSLAEERYKTFPPGLIRRYDVIEIRRVWEFGDGLRIIEEGH